MSETRNTPDQPWVFFKSKETISIKEKAANEHAAALYEIWQSKIERQNKDTTSYNIIARRVQALLDNNSARDVEYYGLDDESDITSLEKKLNQENKIKVEVKILVGNEVLKAREFLKQSGSKKNRKVLNANVLVMSSCQCEFSSNMVKSFHNAIKSRTRIVKRTATILTSADLERFTEYNDWKPKQIRLGESTWTCFLVNKDTSSRYFIAKYSVKFENEKDLVDKHGAAIKSHTVFLKSLNNEYKGDGKQIEYGGYLISLERINKKSKAPRFMYLSIHEDIAKFAEGFMIKQESDGKVIMHPVILQRDGLEKKHKITNTTSRRITYGDHIHDPILANYFSRLSEQMMETNARSLRGRSELDDAAEKRARKRKIIKHDLYISSMGSSCEKESEQLKICQDIGAYIISLLTSNHSIKNRLKYKVAFERDRIHAPAVFHGTGNKHPNYEYFEDNIQREQEYENGRRNFHLSKHHMLILPFKSEQPSAAYDQTTWCFYEDDTEMRGCVCIVRNKSQLSKLFEHDKVVIIELGDSIIKNKEVWKAKIFAQYEDILKVYGMKKKILF